MKSILYYTDSQIEEPIASLVRSLLVGLPVVSVSLEPLEFGTNITVPLERGAITMFNQILAGLEASDSKYVFFCEHDVLYHSSHFDFTPPTDDLFYYNSNVWRWDYPENRLITYNHLWQLSGLCANRELLIDHYQNKLKTIADKGLKEDSPEPRWLRKLGYEPGKVGNRMKLASEWQAEFPNIDIRHDGTFTRRKCRLEDFTHQPLNWRETTLDGIAGWNLRELFS